MDTTVQLVAEWMVANGYITGHGDTLKGLLDNLVIGEREKCAKMADDEYDEAPSFPFDNGGTKDGWQMACVRIGNVLRAKQK